MTAPLRSLLIGLLLVVGSTLFSSETPARVGGGNSFSTGRSSSSGGYSGGGHSNGGGYSSSGGWSSSSSHSSGDGDLETSVIGLVLAGVIALVTHLAKGTQPFEEIQRAQDVGSKGRGGRPSRGDERPSPPKARRPRRQVKAGIRRLQKEDPNFSEFLFLDFAQMIFTRFQEGRGVRSIEGLNPYLAPTTLAYLEKVRRGHGTDGLAVEQVIVGAIALDQLSLSGRGWRARCAIEANYTERRPATSGTETTYCVRCQLTFLRRAGLLSGGPEEMQSLRCPGCGSPVKLDAHNVCAHCKQAVLPGQFHWSLIDYQVKERRPVEQMPLDLSTGAGVETGTDLPTRIDPDLDAATRSFRMRYPDESLERLLGRTRFIFVKLQQAWSARDWDQVRPFETDQLYQMHLFWMERYQRRGLRNVLDQIRIERIEIARLDRDAYYEIATLRIRASMIDYVVDSQDTLQGGSRNHPRVFSEYWTLIRRAGFEPDKDLDDSSCPSCGAPVEVGASGQCEHCDAHLTSGEFDWTLSRIEQDEVYEG